LPDDLNNIERKVAILIVSDTENNNQAREDSKNPTGVKSRSLRMIVLQVLLVLNMVLVLLVVGIALNLIPKPTLQASMTQMDEIQRPVTPPSKKNAAVLPLGEDHPRKSKVEQKVLLPQPADNDLDEVVPWEQVERMFEAKDYDKAFAGYKTLLRYTPRHAEGQLLNDYFQLRIGQCLVRSDKGVLAREELTPVTRSASPILRALSWYELARVDLNEGRFLAARTKAYQAVAAISAMDRPYGLEADCSFLIARVLTEKVRSFQTTENLIRWPSDQTPDPFAKMDTLQIRKLIREGVGFWSPLFDPTLTMEPRKNETGRWRVSCSQLTVENLLNQFGKKAGKDVKWFGVREPAKRRVVNFHFRSTPSQKLSEVAAGMTGLIGRFTLNDICVYDPANATSVSYQRNLLTREAISAWRLFFLRFPTDTRIPDGRFALAALNEWSGEKIDAIHEYALLARRFKRSNAAPKALLQAAKIKISMMNFAKARQDLIDLLDLYPDYPGADKVYLMLAQVNERSGQLDEAVRSYEYLYYRNLSASSRKAACMGAGRCYDRLKKPTEATKWFARYAALIKQPNPNDYVEAYIMMARSEAAQGNYDMAVQAYHRGLAGRPPAETRIVALMELVSVHIRREDFISAIGVLNHLRCESLTKEQECRQAVLTAEVLRSLGLMEKARSVLKLQLSATDIPALRAMVGVELAQCHMDVEDYESAQRLLTEILPLLRDETSLWLAEVLLAKVCLKMNESDQAIRIARKVLDSTAPKDLQRRAGRILGEAFLRKKEYEKAALAFSGLKTSKPSKETK
jgi:tetratricopeptide (TPR) repeat protein